MAHSPAAFMLHLISLVAVLNMAAATFYSLGTHSGSCSTEILQTSYLPDSSCQQFGPNGPSSKIICTTADSSYIAYTCADNACASCTQSKLPLYDTFASHDLNGRFFQTCSVFICVQSLHGLSISLRNLSFLSSLHGKLDRYFLCQRDSSRPSKRL